MFFSSLMEGGGRMPTRLERIEGGSVGLLVGDALGVPYKL